MLGIAISGKAGSGKNALAMEISEHLLALDYWPWELGFADGPKQELFRTRGLTKASPGGRDALVELAHSRREEDPDVWVKFLNNRVQFAHLCGVVPIITDMRYLNEIIWSRHSEYLTVRIDATLLDRMSALMRRGEDPEFANSEHPSECELDFEDFDLRMHNPHNGPMSLAQIAVEIAFCYEYTLSDKLTA